MKPQIGVAVERKESYNKVTGAAKYTNDYIVPGTLYAKMVTSQYAHARIKSIDISIAMKEQGIETILTGNSFTVLCGPTIRDHSPLAIDKVRYFGEPVALVVADSEFSASRIANLVKVEYEPLPVINSAKDALKKKAPLIHEDLSGYELAVKDVYPEPDSNIVNRVKIRKGDIKKGFKQSDIVIEGTFKLPMADHLATETRTARAEILPDGTVHIDTSSQSPFFVKKMISESFNVPLESIIVKTPLVGGAFGGKAAVQLELLAFMASTSVKGRPVKIVNTREEDIMSSPCHLGLETTIKLGASKDGTIKAAELTHLIDTGGYADIGPYLTKSIAVNCTGPYNIENIWCDALCVYTNHIYATSFRGFGHAPLTFCMERTIEKLAVALNMDALELRLKNAIKEGSTSPTQVKITLSNTGDLKACLSKAKELIHWDEGIRIKLGGNKIRAKGISCLWKTSDSPTNATSGVILTFNADGSININCGAVEIGSGIKTTVTQILAEKMKMDVKRIHVVLDVDTQTSPEHWKTVASMTNFMLGKAVIRAADDLIKQLKELASVGLRCSADELDIADERVFMKSDSSIHVVLSDLVHSYKYANGNSIGGQIMATGSYVMNQLTHLDKETGQGKPGPSWTVGAQAVEVEFDESDCTYRLVKCVSVIDAGKVLNPKIVKGLVMGGASMGFGLSTREEFIYDKLGKMQNSSLRTYKVMHYAEIPEYIVDFIETPQLDAPYGARGISEHGIIGIPAALGNALSTAAQVDLNQLPITPELIWRCKGGLS